MKKKPFFEKFLEDQKVDLEEVKGGRTLKFPSDSDEGDVTMKYPSDDDEGIEI